MREKREWLGFESMAKTQAYLADKYDMHTDIVCGLKGLHKIALLEDSEGNRYTREELDAIVAFLRLYDKKRGK